MRKVKNALSYLFLISASLVSVFPFLWMIIGATNSSIDVSRGKLSFGTSFFTNLTNLFATTNIVTAITNSLIIAVV